SANALTANCNGFTTGCSGAGGGDGVDLDNTASGAVSPQNVTLTGLNTFNTNHDGGLRISTFGSISASNLNANGNTAYFGVTLSNSTGTAPKPVTISGTNVFSDNNLGGLNVNSLGAITVNNITAYISPTFTTAGGYQVALSNAHPGGVGTISLTG